MDVATNDLSSLQLKEESKEEEEFRKLDRHEIYRMQTSWREVRNKLKDSGAELFLQYSF